MTERPDGVPPMKRGAWTKGDAERIERKIQGVIDDLHKVNETNEKNKHSFKGACLSQHASAKAAEQALWGIKGTFSSIAFSKSQRKR